MNPEEITCEEGKHYPLYDAANPDHNPSVPRRPTSTQSLRKKHSASSKRSSLKVKPASNKSPQRTITRLFQSLTGSMRAAAHYFHETEDSCSTAENLVKDSGRSSVHFKTRTAIVPAGRRLSTSKAPKPPSLMSIDISSTPFMSVTSLGEESVSECELGPEQTITSTKYQKLSSDDSDSAGTSCQFSGSTPSILSSPPSPTKAVIDDPFCGTSAAIAKPKAEEKTTNRPSYSHIERATHLADDKEAASPLGKSENISTMHGYTSDAESNCDMSETTHPMSSLMPSRQLSMKSISTIGSNRERRPLSPLDLPKLQNAQSLQFFGPIAGAANLKTLNLSVKEMAFSLQSRNISDNYDADAEKSDLEPTMGPRKMWLDAHADRERRYQATMSGTSTDDDSDVGVQLSRSEYLKENRPSRERLQTDSDVDTDIEKGTTEHRLIVADEFVSSLALNRQTPSPASVPLPKSEIFSKSYDPKATSQSSRDTSPTLDVEGIRRFRTESCAYSSSHDDNNATHQERDRNNHTRVEQSYDTSFHLSSKRVQDERSDARILNQASSAPTITLQDELAGIGLPEWRAHSLSPSSETSETEHFDKTREPLSKSRISKTQKKKCYQTWSTDSAFEANEAKIVDALMRLRTAQADVKIILNGAQDKGSEGPLEGSNDLDEAIQ